TGRIPDCARSSGSSPGSKGSGSAIWETGTSCATGWCATSSGRTPRTHRVDMRLPTREELRYHGSRWAWVVGLATLAYVVFPSSATNVEPLVVGTPAEHDVIAPFTFPVNKSDQERVREAEELAGSVKPIYQYQERALDSATIAMHTFFSSVAAAADQGGAAAILPSARGPGFALGVPYAAYLPKGCRRRALGRAR